MNFVIARSVPYMISNIGFGTYFVFAAFLTCAGPFVYFCCPETKGLSLESVEKLFSKQDLVGIVRDKEKGGLAQEIEHGSPK
jgi:hypothetical protein